MAWIIEADIYRLKRELLDASPDRKAKVAFHLRAAEVKLNKLLFESEIERGCMPATR